MKSVCIKFLCFNRQLQCTVLIIASTFDNFMTLSLFSATAPGVLSTSVRIPEATSSLFCSKILERCGTKYTTSFHNCK
jgi:hypothetical protein